MNKIDSIFKTNYAVTTLSIILSLFVFTAQAQVIEFSDDFESGTGNWILTNNWGLDTVSNSPTNSLTESPTANYGNSETSYATMANPVDLSTALDANMSFWTIYNIEFGFDYMYVEASGDGGSNWINIASFDSILTTWTQFSYSLGGFVGSSNVLVRFRFVSDVFVTEDGMYIDDFEITSNSIDNSPPLILHTGPVMHQASLSDQNINAQLIDVSGISLAELSYTVDGGAPQIVTGVNVTADDYLFVIPQQLAGVWVDYWITAIDASDSLNMGTSSTYSYISGNYIVYDNAQVDFVTSFGPGSPSGYPGAAVRITLSGTTDLVTSLIRNYTDINNPNDSMLIHVWANAGGLPGADLITPFMLNPEATLAEPNRITRVDLRPYSSQLSNLSGDVFVGFTVPTGEVWLSQTTPGSAARTFADSLGIWVNINDDFHFRAITDTFAGVTVANFSFNSSGDPVVTFADSSTNTPLTWVWDFGDGSGTSTSQNPGYTYTANGTYNVCLTATNVVGSSTSCQWVTIGGIPTVANFSASATSICQGACVNFTDMSTNTPTSWSWVFPGGTPATDTTQNPTVCYNSVGTYDVTLIVSNGGGPDTMALTAYITSTSCPPPVAAFTASNTMICVGDTVNFTDQSTQTPTSWNWVFTGATPAADTTQNPTVIYNTPGTYDVMLTATNFAGSDTLTMSSYITVNALPATPTISVGGPTTFCQGDSVVLTSSSSTGNTWSNSLTTQAIAVTASGNYTVTVTDGNGCSATSNATTVTVDPLPPTPIISASGTTNMCQGDSVTLTSSSSTGNVWSNSATTQSITVSTSGNHTVTVTDGNGCSATSNTTTVTVNTIPAKPSISAGGPTTFCQGANVVLTSSSATDNIWSNASTTQAITVTTAGSYTVMIVDGNGCTSPTSDAITITVDPLPATPTITPSGPLTFCEGGSVVLSSSSAAIYIWDTGDTTQSITIDSTGTYKVRITDSSGCNSSFSLITSVTENPNPAVPNISQNINVLTSDAATGYQWFMNSTLLTGETSQDYTITQDGTYSVEVTDANGCTAMSDPVNVTFTGIYEVIGNIQLHIYPNPNNGEFILEIELLGNQDVQLSISNVLGQLVYEEALHNIHGLYSKRIDISEYRAGVYALQLIGENRTYTRQIIVE